MFLAEAEREAFADVHVITLYSHCQDRAENHLRMVLEASGVDLGSIDPVTLRQQFEPQLKEIMPHMKAEEFVEVLHDRVVICVDADFVDDEAVARGLDMLTQIDNFEVGTTKQFPPKRGFEYRSPH